MGPISSSMSLLIRSAPSVDVTPILNRPRGRDNRACLPAAARRRGCAHPRPAPPVGRRGMPAPLPRARVMSNARRMGLLRDRHRGDGGDGAAPATAYRMREKMLSIGDDFWIENGAGQRTFKVDGKALRMRKTLVFEDASGHELLRIQERKLSIRDKMAIERDGDAVATVRKALITPLRERFKVELAHGGELDVKGNVVDHEYTFERDGHKIAEVSKRWFRVRDTYGVEIEAGENDVLVLAVTVAIDQMTHDR